jgi:toxin ParE1/3/4
MGYKVIVSPRAQIEIEDAIDYYSIYSKEAPQNFINFLKLAYNTLEINPKYTVLYKNIRALKIQKFPYSLFFIIDEKNLKVRVLSCFHNKRNPENRPSY